MTYRKCIYLKDLGFQFKDISDDNELKEELKSDDRERNYSIYYFTDVYAMEHDKIGIGDLDAVQKLYETINNQLIRSIEKLNKFKDQLLADKEKISKELLKHYN